MRPPSKPPVHPPRHVEKSHTIEQLSQSQLPSLTPSITKQGSTISNQSISAHSDNGALNDEQEEESSRNQINSPLLESSETEIKQDINKSSEAAIAGNTDNNKREHTESDVS